MINSVTRQCKYTKPDTTLHILRDNIVDRKTICKLWRFIKQRQCKIVRYIYVYRCVSFIVHMYTCISDSFQIIINLCDQGTILNAVYVNFDIFYTNLNNKSLIEDLKVETHCNVVT